jgi:glycosyltransferase involved in cell wall biosynthesis
MPKVSIIIPIYNSDKYLAECLDSAIGQTLHDIEIICVNDGSTDRSPQILEEYAAKDSRIITIHQKNVGPGAARNIGINLAKGKYILFLDSDDTIETTLCEKAITVAEQEQADMTFFFKQRDYSINIKEIESLTKIIQHNTTFILEDISFDDCYVFLINLCQPWSKIWRTEFLVKNDLHFPIINYAEDVVVHWNALTKHPHLALLPEIMYFYRENPNSLILNPQHRYGKNITVTYNLLKETLCEAGEYKGTWKDVFLYLKLTKSFDRYVFFIKTKFADEMLIDIKNSFGNDEREYLNNSRNIPWYIKDFYHALDGSQLAAIKNTINIVLLQMKRSVQYSVRNFGKKLKRNIQR